MTFFQDRADNAKDAGMVGSDMATYPALGFNPTPGNTGTVSTLASNFLTVSGHLEQAREAMVNAGRTGGFWEGDAAEAFQGDIGQLPDYLDKATKSLGDAGRALDGWANDLTTLQHSAADYEQQAEAAVRQVDAAQSNPDLGLAGEEFDDQQALAQAQQRLTTAESELTDAENDLTAIREQAMRLFAQHQDLVRDVEDALNKAKDEAPNKPGGFFHDLGAAFGSVLHGISSLAKNTWNFVKQHANVIAKIGDVLSAVGTVLSVAAAATAEIPVVGEVVEAASLGVNAEALGAHALAKAAGANVSDLALASDALGMIPGGSMINGVTKVGKVARVVKSAGKAMRVGEGGARLADGAAAAGRELTEMSTKQLNSWAKTAVKFGRKVPVLSDGVDTTKMSGELLTTSGKEVTAAAKRVYTYDTSSTVAKAAGAVYGTAEQIGIKVGEWEAQPYIDNAEDSAKSFADKLVHGQSLPSAGQVYNQVLHGSHS